MKYHYYYEADVCFVLSPKGRECLSQRLEKLSPSRRERVFAVLEEADSIQEDAAGNRLWLLFDVDWNSSKYRAVKILDTFLRRLCETNEYEVRYAVCCTASDNDFEGGELDTAMAPTIIKRIDFAAGNSVEV